MVLKFFYKIIFLLTFLSSLVGCNFSATIKNLAGFDPKVTIDTKIQTTYDEDITNITVPSNTTSTFYLFKWNKKGKQASEIDQVSWNLDHTTNAQLSSNFQSATFISTAAGSYTLQAVTEGFTKNVLITVVDVTPSISISDKTVLESENVVLVDVVLSNGSGQTITVDWITSNGTATDGNDYTAASGSLVFAPGEISKTISITLLPDILDENNENFNVTLSNLANANMQDSAAVVTITDDDESPSLSVADISIAEDAGSVLVTVSLSEVSGRNVTFNWTTANNTAIAGADYTAVNAVATIAAGATNTTVSVNITEDVLDEDNENFRVNISAAVNAIILDNTATVTITDNDNPPTISIANTTAIEGANMVFTVSLSAASGRNITFDWATSDGTATSAAGGADYTSSNAIGVTIAAGNLSTTVSVPTLTDVLTESDETFTVTISNITNATSGSTLATGTILGAIVKAIYRSIGPGNTTALAVGTTNNLTISNGVALFASPLPDNIGVGDAIQYDSDNNGTIDAIIFIDMRVSSLIYGVKNNLGVPPSDMLTADQNWSIFRSYTGLDNAKNGVENTGIHVAVSNFDTGDRDIVVVNEQWNFAFYVEAVPDGPSNDFSELWTTSETNYIRIYTPYLGSEVGVSQRHSGYYSEQKLNISSPADDRPISVCSEYMRIEGLTIYSRNSTISISYCSAFERLASGAKTYISHNIIKGVPTSGYSRAAISCSADNPQIVYIFNNIIFDFLQDGIGIAHCETVGSLGYYYNNTVANNDVGIQFNSTVLLKNNISYGNSSVDFTGASAAGTTNNLSGDNSASALGINGEANKVVTFMSQPTGDYRLSAIDSSAKNLGVNLSADVNLSFSVDISGETRSGSWDIGASEAPFSKEIFRSVGKGSTSAIAIGGGTNNMIIVGNVATFDSAVNMANSVGIGDVIQYDSNTDTTIDTVAFITSRLSDTSFTLQNASGGSPVGAADGTTTWSIFRAYTGLNDGYGGVENSGINAGVRNFDSWTVRDLVANNESWNFAMYADAPDSAGYWLDGWTTGPNNSIRIFTPYQTNQVGVSQRHAGNFSSGGYLMTDYLWIRDDYVTIEGLVIDWTSSSDNSGPLSQFVKSLGPTRGYITNNLIRLSGANSGVKGIWVGGGSDSYLNEIYIVNNIVVNDITNADSSGIYLSYAEDGAGDQDKIYVYNNTVVSSVGQSFLRNAGDLDLRNNLASSGGSCYVNFGGTGSILGTSTSNAATCASAWPSVTRVNQTFTFVNAGADDYRLSTADTGAKNFGTDLSNNGFYNYKIDILGNLRTNLWSIGATNPY